MARILYFGRLSDAAGVSEALIDLPGSVTDTDALRDWLGRSDPILLAKLRDPALRVAVNQIVVSEPAGIASGDEIAFLSPVSGG